MIGVGYILYKKISFLKPKMSSLLIFLRKGSVELKEEETKMEANSSLTSASEAADKRRFLLR